ncbi:hypothetical protein SARC_11501 [Sphaeroforma arctica JP610]|uniref:C3H1-type domain-containing protein n=1 Tax=Sphaeroforma arctica JP610 TaxID=667725 RepID=A0A0L0FGT6_9EUKA|nr:hypothetical protein SARC_11501 [Sphaeroforma arctica JP610]KNC75987.1 hypothetical protein SARC_11501 [Sphaeroforma arctica JP610]|eukprot:XP_014149889.1 hypothetical protein SARC_11501 [Sphaeroforma arctica JP610]
MFPANKGFESAACPFYQHGLCDRPYCPFAHVVKRTPRTKPQPQPKAPIRPMQQNIASGYYEATQSSKVDRYDSKNSSNVGRFDDSTSGSSRDVEIKVVEVGETRTPREGPTVLSSSPFAISPARPSNPDTVPQPTVKPVRKTQDPLHTDKPNPYKAGDTPNTTQETRKRPHTSAGTHTAELDPTEQRRRQSVTKGKGFMREAQLNLEAMRKKPRLDPPGTCG